MALFASKRLNLFPTYHLNIVEMAISRLQDLEDDGKDVHIFFQTCFEDTGYLVVVRSRWAESGNDLTDSQQN